MRTLTVLLSSMLGIWVCAGPAAPGKTQEKANPKEGSRVRIVEMIQDLNLTDEQETKIKEIRTEYRPKVESAVKEVAQLVKEEMEKVREVLTPEQKEKIKNVKEERRQRERSHEFLTEALAHFQEMELTEGELTKIEEIRKETRPKIEKALEAVHGILTEEQKKSREEGLKAGKPRSEIMASLNLKEDQKKILMAAGKEVTAAVREELEKIKAVLTESQQAKLQELKEERKEHVRDRVAHEIANHKELNLTDEEKNKIMEIRKEFRPKIHEAGNKLRATVREEVEAVSAVIK